MYSDSEFKCMCREGFSGSLCEIETSEAVDAFLGNKKDVHDVTSTTNTGATYVTDAPNK
jgi:hypothetical protein